MTRMTPEIRRAIQEAAGVPVRLDDPESQRTYVLLEAEEYERLRTPIADDDLDARAAYPLVWQVMEADWTDPAMDVYDEQRDGT